MFPWFLGAISAAGSLLFFYSAYAAHGKIKLIENTKTSEARKVMQGIVEVCGTVVPKETLKSPFTNSDCVYYEFEVEEYRGGNTANGSQSIQERKQFPSS